MSEFDLFEETGDSSPAPLTRDFIGLCIGILSVVIVILIVAVCKWSRCLCLKQNHNDYDQTEGLTAVIGQNSSVPRPSQQRHPGQNQQLSSYDHPSTVPPSRSTARDGLLLSPQRAYNGRQPNDLKVPRVTITALSVQPSQQLVPRLSISPQVSASSITHNPYLTKQ